MEQDTVVRFSPAFKGAITLSDLLSSEGTLIFVTEQHSIQSGGFLFHILFQNFVFCLSFQDNSIVIQRNDTVSILSLEELLEEENRNLGIFVMWSHYKLILDCRSGDKVKRVEVPTMPTAPPAQLITWARKHKLIPTETYTTEEEFREKIHASLSTINQKIREADAYKSFWNIVYEGNRIINRQPKKEVEIQPLIHCFLSDQMLLGNIEVIPEYKTGEGNLDFLFIGQVEGLGICKFCVEFKLAHSVDLDNGLLHQLPRYMDVSNATYGAYCVLNFKGDWFDQPKLKEGENLGVNLHINQLKSRNPVHERIRWFIFDLAKPTTAGKKP
jgi:hypothetical protein